MVCESNRTNRANESRGFPRIVLERTLYNLIRTDYTADKESRFKVVSFVTDYPVTF